MQVSGPVKEDTVIGPKIAAVERREARVPVTTARGRLREVPNVICAVPALRSLMQMREEMKARAPRLSKKGPMNHACLLP